MKGACRHFRPGPQSPHRLVRILPQPAPPPVAQPASRACFTTAGSRRTRTSRRHHPIWDREGRRSPRTEMLCELAQKRELELVTPWGEPTRVRHGHRDSTIDHIWASSGLTMGYEGDAARIWRAPTTVPKQQKTPSLVTTVASRARTARPGQAGNSTTRLGTSSPTLAKENQGRSAEAREPSEARERFTGASQDGQNRAESVSIIPQSSRRVHTTLSLRAGARDSHAHGSVVHGGRCCASSFGGAWRHDEAQNDACGFLSDWRRQHGFTAQYIR